MEAINPADWPWTTQNAALAYCLYMAGVPFMDERHPCESEYTEEMVRGYLNPDGSQQYAGLTVEEAIRAAHAEGKEKRKGKVTFYFKPIPEIPDLTAAYADQEKELEEGEGTAQVVHRRIMERCVNGEITASEALVRTHCVALKLRPDFMGMWKLICPNIRINHPGKPRSVPFSEVRNGKRVEGRIVTRPGCKIFSLNASTAIRKHLKV